MANQQFDRIYKIFSQLSLSKVSVEFQDGIYIVSVLKPLEQQRVVHLDKTNPTCGPNKFKCQLLIVLAELFVENGIQVLWRAKSRYPGIQQLLHHKPGWKEDDKPERAYILLDEKALNLASRFVIGTKLNEEQCSKEFRDVFKKVFRGHVICRVDPDDSRCDFDELKSLDHPNIEKMSHTDFISKFFFYKTPLYSLTLTQFLSGNDNTGSNRKKLLLAILCGATFMKECQIIHGAIHPNNIAWDGKHWLLTDAKKMGIIGSEKTKSVSDLLDLIVLVIFVSFELDGKCFYDSSFCDPVLKFPHKSLLDQRLMKTESGRQLKELWLMNEIDIEQEFFHEGKFKFPETTETDRILMKTEAGIKWKNWILQKFDGKNLSSRKIGDLEREIFDFSYDVLGEIIQNMPDDDSLFRVHDIEHLKRKVTTIYENMKKKRK